MGSWICGHVPQCWNFPTHGLEIHFANYPLLANMQESLWSPVTLRLPEEVTWITPQLVLRFNVSAFWLLEQAWAGRSKYHPPKRSFQLFLFCPSYRVLQPTALKYLWRVNKVLALMELLKMPTCSKVPRISYLWRTMPWAFPMLDTSEFRLGNMRKYFFMPLFWYICLKRHRWVNIHTHTNISPFLQSWIKYSQFQTHIPQDKW